MLDFPVFSSLPKSTNTVILGNKYRIFLEKSLIKLGIDALYVPDNPDIDSRLAGHADLSVFYRGGEHIFLAPYLKESFFANKLVEQGFVIDFPDIFQDVNYPYDAQLNICSLTDHFIFNKTVSSTCVVNYLTKLGSKGINVKQGYANCCTCVTGKKSIITSDSGIASACKNHDFDVLLIRNGYIDLPGFEYGFIGGSSFMLSECTIAFTGKLDNHPDKEKILDFLHGQNIEAVYLSELPIFDVGCIIPIAEKQP